MWGLWCLEKQTSASCRAAGFLLRLYSSESAIRLLFHATQRGLLWWWPRSGRSRCASGLFSGRSRRIRRIPRLSWGLRALRVTGVPGKSVSKSFREPLLLEGGSLANDCSGFPMLSQLVRQRLGHVSKSRGADSLSFEGFSARASNAKTSRRPRAQTPGW